MSTIINTKIHSFVQALACKQKNETLSPRTLKKLTLIANREFGGRAERVFSPKLQGSTRFNGDAAGLRAAISSQLQNVRSPGLKQIMSQWLAQLPAPHAQAGHSRPVQVDQYVAPPQSVSSTVMTWFARNTVCGSAQLDDVPAAGIPPVDYLEADVPEGGIPLPDYDDAPEPAIPPVDYGVHFSKVVEVVYVERAESESAPMGGQ